MSQPNAAPKAGDAKEKFKPKKSDAKAQNSKEQAKPKKADTKQAPTPKDAKSAPAQEEGASTSSTNIGAGGAVHGNFHNYYNFNPTEQRMASLPATLPLCCLPQPEPETKVFTLIDIGCNEGNLTVAMLNLCQEGEY
jgi:hypothetical protein